MPTDDPRDSPVPGFQSYADDTPRELGAWEREREFRSWDEPQTARPSEPAFEPERARAAVWPKVAVAVAVLAAFGGGFLLAGTDDPTAAMARRPASEAAAMAAARPMNVEVAEAAPIPMSPPSSTARLEVLPPPPTAPVQLAPRPFPARPAEQEARVLSITPRPAPQPTPAPAPPVAREVAQAPVARDAAAVAPAPASFDCRDAPSLAREMVCSDRGLAAMDQRMKRAYAAALAAGAPEDELAADQSDWLDIREEAARRSRRSVANIYSQRIGELEAMAERGWR